MEIQWKYNKRLDDSTAGKLGSAETAKKVQIKNGRIYNTDTNTDKNENTGRYVKR